MAKKSFLIYIDSLDILDELSDEEAGKLFKAIKSSQQGEQIELDPLTRIAFAPFKAQFARDNEKYQSIVDRNKINGLKGGRPKTQTNPDKPTGFIGNPENPGKPHSDSDSDSDNRAKPISINSQSVVDAYHECLPMLSKIQVLSDKRKTAVRSFFKKRTKEKGSDFTIDNFRAYLGYISTNCKWMLEDRPNGKGGFWKAKNFDYLLKDDCYIAVKEERHNDMGSN